MQDIVIEQHQKIASDDMGGLEPKLFLAVGARTMLTRNPWQEKACVMDLWVPFQTLYTKKMNSQQLCQLHIL